MYGYVSGLEQPNTEVRIPKGQMTAGHAVGIICMDVPGHLFPGHVGNASTYNFPVLYQILEEVTVQQVFRADPTVLDALIRGGKELEKRGVRAISTHCGFFANYQKEVAAALNVPVFLSSILQLPLISRALKPSQKVGIITADSTSLSASLLSACGVDDPSTLVVAGFQDLPESKNILQGTGHYNSAKIEEELVGLARQLVNDNPNIGAFLLECASLPTYAWSIQNAVNRPVFDFVTMINWIYDAVVRRPFAGFR